MGARKFGKNFTISPVFPLVSHPPDSYHCPAFAEALQRRGLRWVLPSMNDGGGKWRERGKAFRAEGIAFAIPMVMLVYPIGAALLGKYAAKYTGLPWLFPVILVAGLIVGVRECIRLIKLLNRLQK